MKDKSVYRVHVIKTPEFETYMAFDNRRGEAAVRWARPVGWRADGKYIEKFGSDKWFSPETDKWFKARSSAADRVRLLRKAGYEAVVQRSAPVVWPEGDAEQVDESGAAEVMGAIRVLVRHGVVRSADELIGR